MEDLKQIQEFFSNPLEEKMVTPKRGHNYYQLYRDTPIKYISGRSGMGLEVPGVLLHNEYDTINGQEGAYIIDYFGQHFYVDMENKFASKIANPRDPEQNEDLIKNMGRTALAPEFSNWKKYLNVPLEEYNTGIYYDPAKERNAIKAKQASKSGIEKVKDMLKKIMKEDMSLDDQAKAYFLAKVKKGEIDTLPDNPKASFLAQMMKNQMGEALSDSEEKEANYDELYKGYKYKVDEAKPKKGHGEKISREVFSKLKGKTINYKGADYKVLDSDEAVLKIKHLEDGDVTTINLRQFNVSGMIEEILETIELGRQLDEKKLCKKGEAYRKKRMAAGEKSSAYLSGRAVKVCKGQMKG